MTSVDQIWLPPPADPLLAPGEVHVWRAALNLSAASIQALQQTLSADELDRAERYKFLRDRRRFIAARGMLRAVLGRYLNLEPSQIQFCYNAYGKPALDSDVGRSSKLSFSVAHSGELALYAVTLSRRIGVDLERVRVDLDYQQIAERFFSPHERSALRAIPTHLKPAAFFNCWTRKEAYIKARGEGLSLPLDQFAVSLAADEPAKLLDIAGDPREMARWSLHELQPGPAYVGALALESVDWQLRCWQWPEY